MEEKKKKKKLTLSISSNRIHNVSHYGQSSGKTSVVIEKKPQRRIVCEQYSILPNKKSLEELSKNIINLKY